jgi:hypothetical protein
MKLVLLLYSVACAFYDHLLTDHLRTTTYFEPEANWPQPIESQNNLLISLQQLYLLGDTRRCELLVFAEANPARLPTEMCLLIPLDGPGRPACCPHWTVEPLRCRSLRCWFDSLPTLCDLQPPTSLRARLPQWKQTATRTSIRTMVSRGTHCSLEISRIGPKRNSQELPKNLIPWCSSSCLCFVSWFSAL